MKLSIITCTKNSEEFLPELLLSIKSQIDTSFEHIIVDGLSRDKTLNLLRDYKKGTKNAVKIYSRKPKGISDAMNFGFQKSKGEIVLFIQSDDRLYCENIVNYAERLINSDKNVLVGKCFYIDKKNRIIAERPKKHLYWMFKLRPSFFIKLTNFIPHPSVLMKKKTLKRFSKPYDTKLKLCMDYDLWLRLLKKERPLFTNDYLSCFRFHDSGASSSQENYELFFREEVQVKKKYNNKLMLFFSDRILKSLLKSRNLRNRTNELKN